jgi:RNA polymerase sigma-70 factor, ECF subfamily
LFTHTLESGGRPRGGNGGGLFDPAWCTAREVGSPVIPDSEAYALAARAKQGDKDAFAALVTAYKGVLYNVSIRMTGNRDVADDLVQESFLRAYAALGTFNSRKPFHSWLYAICLNVVRDHLRRRGRTVGRTEDLDARPHVSASPNPKDALLARERHDVVLAALRDLPLPLRECLVLRYYQDLSFGEVAAVCAISENAAKKRVYKALLLLQQSLPQDLLENQD